VIERGVTDASASTIWRWLADDAIKPWQQRCWIFVRDPLFREKAVRALDLYQRVFEGRRLRPDEYVISADGGWRRGLRPARAPLQQRAQHLPRGHA
jgi:hypothetical protein